MPAALSTLWFYNGPARLFAPAPAGKRTRMHAVTTDAWPRTDPESAAALRAYLQRCEVRLSTVHRVASALLSGAGLVVLFPALAKDSVARIIRALLEGPADAPHRLVLVGIIAAAILPVVASGSSYETSSGSISPGSTLTTTTTKNSFPASPCSRGWPQSPQRSSTPFEQAATSHHR